ncbi:MAG: acyl-CoA thioesterase [Ferruginibacter sp.]
MQEYFKIIEIRWADLDPNFHVLHSRYYDFGAYCRMSFLTENGISAEKMQEYHIGPIIFREECLFKKEIKFGDEVKVTLRLDKVTENYRKWTMVHELYINGGTLAALITVDGAWMNTQLRKTAVPPADFAAAFDLIPHTPGFTASS